MNPLRARPLSVGPVRAFEAVARLLSFRAAADELHLTQSAISRQIRALEEEVGSTLFLRGTRHVALTSDGATLLRTVAPWLDRLDATVRQLRQARERQVVTLSTFASFSSMWMIPQLEAFQRAHPDIDIRVSAGDALINLDDDSEIDLVLRYCNPRQAPAGAVQLFGEVLTPVISPWLAARIASGEAPPMAVAADLAQHTLAEEDDGRPGSVLLSWRNWLSHHGQPTLQPRRWMYLNYTYQQIQAALAGQAVALARLAMVAEQLAKGELVEPFGPGQRITTPYAYWLIVADRSRDRPEVRQFCDWVAERAARTLAAMASPAQAAGTAPS
jgi:LysR family glycine cleavage system transcriptional activator